MKTKLGLSGGIARRFQSTQITPLLALVGLLMGVFAVLVTPREEEPQINVTFANVFIPFPGAAAQEVESLVASPAEQVLSEIEGIKHVYSTSMPGMAVLTVQYEVGEDRTDAIVRLFSKIFSKQDWLPPGLGVGQPIVKPKGIDDVPIVSLTLWSDDPDKGSYDLAQVAHAIEVELKRVPGTRDIYTIGDPDRVVAVTLDPQALASHNLDPRDLRLALMAANSTRDNIEVVTEDGEMLVQAGVFLSHAEDLGNLVVGVFDGKPVYLRDVATIREGADTPQSYVWIGAGPHAPAALAQAGERPAVTIAVAKKPGTNAVDIASAVIQRFEQLRGIYVPDGVQVEVTRNYGATADAKAKKLISKLIFATASVVLLVLLTLGWREAVIVGAAVIVTLLITLFASWAWG
ncbi:MAG TPA: efflux RND transporter permease subunit, partial [Gammaproteobacteria bacterium]|nr:efflux RND transporter permease subunit [Gammaproteobacteria bacterium]